MADQSQRILHITRNISPVGGCEIYIRNLIKISQHSGYQINLITASKTHDAPVEEAVLPELSSYEHAVAKKSASLLESALKAIQPDLIHIHDLNNPYVIQYCGENFPTVKTTLNADAYCGGTDKYLYTSGKECHFRLGFGCLPIAYYENCMSRHPRRSLEIISIKKKSIQSLQHTSKVVVPSERSKAILMHEGVRADKIEVIPLFAFRSDEPPQPYPQNSAQVLFLGRLRPYKGVSYLLRAFQKIKAHACLLIVGDGEERAKLENLSAKLGITNRVRFLGNRPHAEINSLLDSCSILAVPSIYPDSFPTVGLEAMARARPVVGFSIGGIPEWLTNGKTGFLVKAQDVNSLAEKLDYLLNHPEIAEKMGAEGKRVSDEKFTEVPHMKMMSRLYQEAIAAFSKPHTEAQ